jgi:two-component system, OmpR family, alkaline phosphatase synthesis response regulator PhoP
LPLQHPEVALSASQETAPARILVVDDDANARTISATWLAHVGYDVRAAHSAEAAVEAARSHRPHLVLVDLLMPVVDGWSLLERLKEEPAARDAVLVALTVLNPDEDRRDPVRRGFDEYWVKPLKAPDLLDRIRQALQSAGVPAAPSDRRS